MGKGYDSHSFPTLLLLLIIVIESLLLLNSALLGQFKSQSPVEFLHQIHLKEPGPHHPFNFLLWIWFILQMIKTQSEACGYYVNTNDKNSCSGKNHKKSEGLWPPTNTYEHVELLHDGSYFFLFSIIIIVPEFPYTSNVNGVNFSSSGFAQLEVKECFKSEHLCRGEVCVKAQWKHI